jgi:hypothetical protein
LFAEPGENKIITMLMRLAIRQLATLLLAFAVLANGVVGAFPSVALMDCDTVMSSVGTNAGHDVYPMQDQGMPCKGTCWDCNLNCETCIARVNVTLSDISLLLPDWTGKRDWALLPAKTSRTLQPTVPPPIAIV